MEVYFLIGSIALIASLLTFFSGFGLGTLLMPAFIIAGFELEMAIALTAIVHLLNNLFKIILVRKHIQRDIVLRFGIAAAIGAFFGSQLLFLENSNFIIHEYQMQGNTYRIEFLKLMVAILITLFAILEMIPKLNFALTKRLMPVGGFISGFFGGLSGHQGALRSAFLIKAGLSKETFIATGVVIACFIDVTRIGVYSNKMLSQDLSSQISLIVVGTLCAFTGAFLGNKLLKKITIKFLQIIVSVFIILFSFALALGWV